MNIFDSWTNHQKQKGTSWILNHVGFKLNKAVDIRIQLTNMFQDGTFAIFPKADCCDHAAMSFCLHSLVHINIFCDASPHIPFSNYQNENEHEHVFFEFGLVLSLRGLWQEDFPPRWIWLQEIGPKQGLATMPSHSIMNAWWTLPLELAELAFGVEVVTSTWTCAPIHYWNNLELVFGGI